MAANTDEYIARGSTPLYEPCKGGLGYEIFHALGRNKSRIMQKIIETGEIDTYGDLLTRSIRAAIYLSKKNLKKDDIITFAGGNHIDSMVPFIASKFVGIIHSTIEVTVHEDDIVYILNKLQTKILFVTSQDLEKMENCLKRTNLKCEIVVMGNSAKYSNFSEWLKPSEEENNFSPVFLEDLKETATICHSSGTTGKPKIICLNHYGIQSQAINTFFYIHRKGTIAASNFSHKFNDIDEPNYMFYSPWNWISGLLITLGLMFTGGTRVVGTYFNAKEAWEALEKYKPHTLFLAISSLKALCEYMSNHTSPNTSLQLFITGGNLTTKAHMEAMMKNFPKAKVVQVYGQSETTGVVTAYNIDNPHDMELQYRNLDSCGMVKSGMQIKVVDPDTGKICGVRVPGELRIKNKFIMNGYYKMDPSEGFDSEGWFKATDLGYYDENRCFYIIDRVKEMIVYKQHKVSPVLIERILEEHPAVHECFVFGLPHPQDRAHPMGVVVLKENFKGKVTQDELVTFVNERVKSDEYKLRGGMKFLEEMMKTGTGKLKKLDMTQLIIAGEL